MVARWTTAWLVAVAGLTGIPAMAQQGPATPPPAAQAAQESVEDLGLQNKHIIELYSQGKYAEALPLAEAYLAKAKARFGEQSKEQAAALSNLAMLYKAVGRIADAEPLLRTVLAIHERVSGQESPQVALALSNLGSLVSDLNRNDEAEGLYRRALAIDEKASGAESPATARDLNNLANHLHKVSRLAEAEPLMRRVLALLEKAHGAEHPDVSIAVNNLARLLEETERFAEAEALMRRSLAMDEKLLGAEHPNVALRFSNLGMLLFRTNRAAEAETMLRRALAIEEKVFGADHMMVARDLGNLANIFMDANRRSEAEPLLTRSLAINEKLFGPKHPLVATQLGNLGAFYALDYQLDKAEDYYRRALEIEEKALGPNHPRVGVALNNLAMLLASRNRVNEAEEMLHRTLGITEAALGPNHSNVATALSNLAVLLQRLERYDDAEPLLSRALDIELKTYGPEHPSVAISIHNLASNHHLADRLTEAEPLYRRALAIDEKNYGPVHPIIATRLNNLGGLLNQLNRMEEAEVVTRRALDVAQQAFAPEHYQIAVRQQNLATILLFNRKHDEALPLIVEATKRVEKQFGPDHPDMAQQHAAYAWANAMSGDWRTALDSMRKSTAVTIANAQKLRARSNRNKRTLDLQLNDFRSHALMAARVRPNDPALHDEAFQMAQRAQLSEAGNALGMASARFAADTSELGGVVRHRQDLASAREGADKKLLAALGAGNTALAESLRRDISSLDAQIAEFAARLAKDFPTYTEFAQPEPLTIAAVQEKLAPDEVLITYMGIGDDGPIKGGVMAWAISKTEIRTLEIALGTSSLRQEVAALRCGLDYSSWDGATGELCRKLFDMSSPVVGKPLPFDLDRAHTLYQVVFGPFENMVAGKRLLIVPSGALTALPFHVLVTQKPAVALPGNWQGYRGVQWLGRQNAITVLPSVTSIGTARKAALQESEPFIGFGDPALDGNPRCPAIPVPTSCPGDAAPSATSVTVAKNELAPAVKSLVVAALHKYFRGGVADVSAVRKLCPLPDTAQELRCVARSVKAPDSVIFTGKAANETTLKRTPLSRYKIVHFATHGLLSDESATLGNGLAEPALVLSPPETPTEDDDGLLTASEVTQLKLNADWVVLSACNTAGSGKPGGEALSGLARAFFYAGARTLLVSHWPVDSNAATALTSATFKAFTSGTVTPAEALRSAMVSLMDDKHAWNAHPIFWAPFVVVGGTN